MKLKIFIFLGILGFSLTSFFISPVLAANESLDGLDKVVNSSQKLGVLKNMSNVEDSAATIIGTVLSYVGVAFLILMIYGGVLWMVSRGDTKQLEKARDIILNAAIGIIIVFFAYAITSYVGNKLTGSQSQSTGNSNITPPTTNN